jgi:hypothetical protein
VLYFASAPDALKERDGIVDYFVLKQHAIATYLQLVVGCDRILYDAEWWGTREPPIDLVGTKGNDLAIVVDIAEKFSSYPKGMRLPTLKRKLIQRFVAAHERLRSWGFQKIQGEVWFLGAAREALELVLPSVAQILWRERQMPINIVLSAEAQQRIAQATEKVRQLGRDVGNPFAQSILLASGMLETPPRIAEALPPQFPLELPDPYAIPTFVEAFLTSGYLVDWLGFDLEGFYELWDLARQQRSSAWSDLFALLDPLGNPYPDERAFFGTPSLPPSTMWAVTPKFSSEQVVSILRWVINNAARAVQAWRERWRQPLVLEIGFLLPYLSRNPHFPPEVIEAEIARYGGDRDLARLHFQLPRPDKHFYRGYLRLVLQGPYDATLPVPRLSVAEVSLRSPFLPRGTMASLSVLYPPEFAGYFWLTFQAIAQAIRPKVLRLKSPQNPSQRLEP